MRILLLGTLLSIVMPLSAALAQTPVVPTAKPVAVPGGGPDILVNGTLRPKHHDWRDHYHGGHIHCMMMLKKGQMVRDCR